MLLNVFLLWNGGMVARIATTDYRKVVLQIALTEEEDRNGEHHAHDTTTEHSRRRSLNDVRCQTQNRKL